MSADRQGRPLRPIALFLLVTLLCAASMSCKNAPPSPEETARTFLEHVRAQRTPKIWAALSRSSQKELQARHAALEGEQSANDPEAVLRTAGLDVLGAPENPVLVSPPGDQVTVRVSGPLGSADLFLVKEAGGWKVDLWRSLEPVRTSSTSTTGVTPPPRPPE